MLIQIRKAFEMLERFPLHDRISVTRVVRLKFSNIWFEGMRRQDLLSSITPSGIHDSDDASNDASAAARALTGGVPELAATWMLRAHCSGGPW